MLAKLQCKGALKSRRNRIIEHIGTELMIIIVIIIIIIIADQRY